MREQEAKLAVDDDFEVPPLDDVLCGLDAQVVAPVERVVEDTYYDTADLRLLRWGCTLRHRKRSGWTVKLPIGRTDRSVTRNEINLGGRAGKPPAEALRLVASFSRSAPIEAIARIATRRVAVPIRSADGVPLVELTDDRVVTECGEKTTAFRQLEVELAPDADPTLLDRIVDGLLAGGARLEPDALKLVRALDRPTVGSPDVVVPGLTKDPTARDVIHGAIARSVQQLLVELPRTRLGEEPEGIHQARVATRRLRSDLRTFKPLLDPAWAADLNPRLQVLAAHLGAVRDADVLHQLLRSVLDANPEIDGDAGTAVLELLERQRHDALDALNQCLDHDDTSRLLDDLVAAAADPPTTPDADQPAKDQLPPLVAKRWRHLRRAVAALDRHPPAPALHEVRILAKRARYATEAIAPAFGTRTRQFAKSLAALQDTLGDLNDGSVAGRWLTTNADQLDPVAAFAAGRLAHQLHHAPGDEWRGAWKAVERSRPRWLA
ncbi:MAG: CHAD domain-containing protein [Acidimicrobiales bacterium]